MAVGVCLGSDCVTIYMRYWDEAVILIVNSVDEDFLFMDGNMRYEMYDEPIFNIEFCI